MQIFYICGVSGIAYAKNLKPTNPPRPVESHSRARGNILVGHQNIFTGPL